ncbi:ABC transporter substrate-binding protein [Halosimplex pelagicum]|uniref:ABC transporter substrate-binding protein n=1 Tax=Halosimplex pelagicum TaxID=869886 RepID=A0A7D5TAQ3_9EURY|nr:ABC transporter substrate-binding protein [Halosimplex pelagicum]QLH81673.1 ABC transporter substrate-binding protein [Halosimplex pelagicum]
MNDDTDSTDVRTPTTRRGYLGRVGALAASGVVAGCTTGGGTEGATDGPDGRVTDTPTASPTPEPTPTETATETATPTSYAASIEPVGEIALDDPPETVVSGWGFVGDVLTALGHADSVVGMSRPGFWYQGFYELLPEVSMRDTTEIPATVSKGYSVDEELLYELDPDLLATDPNRYIGWYGLDAGTVRTLGEEVAPFFGNESRSKRSSGWPNWPDGEAYDYYSIPEFVERYGRLFGEAERAAAMVDLYETTIEDVTSRVPPEGDRPTVGLLNAFANPESRGFFAVTDPNPALDVTHELKQYGDLGVVDAFDGMYPDEGGHYDLKTGFEGLLEADPDVLVFQEAVNALGGQNVYGNTEAYEGTLDLLRNDDIGRQLSAVEDGRLYPGGTGSQGPIVNLFQTEMLAKQLYPEEFGEWHGFGETPTDEQLFDRQRVADIVNGDI